MALHLNYAAQLANIFKSQPPSQTSFKNLSYKNRVLCFKAFELIRKANEKKLSSHKKLTNNDIKRLTQIKTDLQKVCKKKKISWIAHKIRSLFKGIANLFGRVSSKKLMQEYTRYCNSIETANYQIKKLSEQIKRDESHLSRLEQSHKDLQGQYLNKDQSIDFIKDIWKMQSVLDPERKNDVDYINNICKPIIERYTKRLEAFEFNLDSRNTMLNTLTTLSKSAKQELAKTRERVKKNEVERGKIEVKKEYKTLEISLLKRKYAIE